jgi:hypothetical protein
MERIWIAELSHEQLIGWLKPPRIDVPFSILERIDAIDFPACDEDIFPERWLKGRIFGSGFELRWERVQEIYQVRLTGKNDPGHLFAEWPAAGDALTQNTNCYLWGENEMRIGRRLEFRSLPPSGGRLRLKRLEFRHKSNRSLIADRYIEMKWEAM